MHLDDNAPYTWTLIHTTPLQPTTLHTHHPPDHTPAHCSHLSFGYKKPVRGVPLGLALVFATDSAHTNHSINTRKHPTRAPLVTVIVPSSSPHQRAFVCGARTGTAQVGVVLVSCLAALFNQSRLHCSHTRLHCSHL